MYQVMRIKVELRKKEVILDFSCMFIIYIIIYIFFIIIYTIIYIYIFFIIYIIIYIVHNLSIFSH